jgi:hypothetical protein
VTDTGFKKRTVALLVKQGKAALGALPELERAKWRRYLRENPNDILYDDAAVFTLADVMPKSAA